MPSTRGMIMGSGEGSTMRKFIICTVYLIGVVLESRRLIWAGHVTRMEEDRNTLKTLKGKRIIVRVIKSRRLRWAGHIARIEDGRNAVKI